MPRRPCRTTVGSGHTKTCNPSGLRSQKTPTHTSRLSCSSFQDQERGFNAARDEGLGSCSSTTRSNRRRPHDNECDRTLRCLWTACGGHAGPQPVARVQPGDSVFALSVTLAAQLWMTDWFDCGEVWAPSFRSLVARGIDPEPGAGGAKLRRGKCLAYATDVTMPDSRGTPNAFVGPHNPSTTRTKLSVQPRL